jgi:predicted nucleic acid-binding protein
MGARVTMTTWLRPSMTVFVDTSAFYAVLDRADENHVLARDTWLRLLREEHVLLTTNYVLLETCALLQNRLGIPALRAFHQEIVPLLQIEWISEFRHQSGVEAALVAARKRLSVVDCIAFQTMRESGVGTVFCFDRHYLEQGFSIVPK